MLLSKRDEIIRVACEVVCSALGLLKAKMKLCSFAGNRDAPPTWMMVRLEHNRLKIKD